MNILTGVDVVETARVLRLQEKFGGRFKSRVFTAREQAYCDAMPRPELHYAARFCAKEAVSKALKTGLSGGIRWTDIEIVNTPSGAPEVVLHGKAAERLAELRGLCVDISLSHSDSLAAASAVILTE